MDSLHNALVFIAKTGGLFYLLVLSIVVVAYVYWPGNRSRFNTAARSILEEDDKP